METCSYDLRPAEAWLANTATCNPSVLSESEEGPLKRAHNVKITGRVSEHEP